MPTYEYRCPAGHEFEKFVQKISLASAALPCPVCGKTAERQISAGGGFVFKGSGFYITDYGKDGKKDLRANAAAASAADEKASARKSEGKSPGDSGSKSESGSPPASGVKIEGTKSESSKHDSGKSDGAKSDRPSAKPSAPKSPGKDK